MAKKDRKLFKNPGSKYWTCRFQWRDKNGKKDSYQKSLRTVDKELAYIRHDEVFAKLDDIKEGLNFVYSWERYSKYTKIKIKTVSEALEKYKEIKVSNGISNQTIERFEYSFNNLFLSGLIGEKSPVKELSHIDFDRFKTYWINEHSLNTIWIDLSKIRAFLNFCMMKKWIKAVPYIEVKYRPKQISYFTDDEFNELIKSSISKKWRRAFFFYRETGCRKREPFISTLIGDTLIVPPLKQGTNSRRILLSDILISIYKEMISEYNYRKNVLNHKPRSIWDSYYDKLKIACKEKKLNHSLHDLRDTYIVRQWAITGDIHLVSKLIAHSSIMQTVEYAQFKPNELIAHFPSLKEYLEPRLIDPNTQMEHTLLEHSYQNIHSPLVGKQGI